MKKIFTILLCFAMIFSTFPCCVYAAEGAIFDLDLSLYKTYGTVSDSSGNYTVSTVGTNPAAAELEVNGYKTPYLQFEKTRAGFSVVADDKMLNQNSLTVEAWINPAKDDEDERVAFALSSAPANATLKVAFENNNCVFYADQNEEISETVDISDYMDKWNHYVFNRSYITAGTETTVKYSMYINGNLVLNESVSGTKSVETGKSLYIGLPFRLGNSTTYFDGGIADLKIYNKTLTRDEILDSYYSEYEYFSQQQSSDDSEISGNSKIFELNVDALPDTTANILYSEADKTGVTAGLKSYFGGTEKKIFDSENGKTPYLKFNAGDILYADTAENASWQGNDAMTYSVWARIEADGTIMKASGALQSSQKDRCVIRLFSSNTSSRMYVNGQGESFVRASATASSNYFGLSDASNWHLYTFTRQVTPTNTDGVTKYAITYNYYVDGIKKSTDWSVTGLEEAVSDNVFILGSNGLNSGVSNNAFKGDIGYAVVYNTVLSDEQIETEYNSTLGSFTQSPLSVKDAEVISDMEYITLNIGSGVDFESLSETAFSLESTEEARTINCRFVKSTDNTVLMYPSEYLKPDTEYKVSAKSIALTDGTTANAQVKFQTKGFLFAYQTEWFDTSDNSPVNSLGNTDNIRLRLTLIPNETSCDSEIIMVSYNADNQFVSTQSRSISDFTEKTTLYFDADCTSISKIAVYVFDYTDGNYKLINNIPYIFK